MLGPDDLAIRLAALTGRPWNGILYRAIFLEDLFGFHRPTRHARPLPLYSLGAPAHGARYTPRGGMATLYMAEGQETAFAEAHQIGTAIKRQDPSSEPRRPTVLVSARVHLDSVLDVADPALHASLGTDVKELLRPWRRAQCRGAVATQQLGLAVFTSGRFQAIRYPSARLAGRCCFAIFTDRLAGAAFVEIYDPDGNVYQRIP
jgi:RES domain-containing protein